MATGAKKTSKFLFVDNDVSSISSPRPGQPRSRFAVNSHVQRWRVGQSKYSKALNPPHEAQPSQSSQRVFCWRLKGPHGRRSLQPARSSATLLVHQLHPFASTDVQLDVESSSVLLYFASKWTPSACKCIEGSQTPLCTWPGIKAIPRSSESGGSSIDETIRRCLFDKMHMYALLAASAGRMKYITKDHLKRVDLPEFYMAKAIRMLRTHLAQCQNLDQQCILDLFFLCSFETYARNYIGAQSYLRIIRDVTGQFFCDIDLVDEHIRRLCWNADLRLAFILGTQPVFQLTWDPGPVLNRGAATPRTILDTASGRAPVSSVLKRLLTLAGPPLYAILEELIECAQAMRCMLAERDHMDRQCIIDRATALLHRLISLSANQRPSTAEGLREECCRQALILWTWNILIGSMSTSSGSANAQHLERMAPLHGTRLRETIYSTYSMSNQCWSSHTDVLFWIMILGTTVAGGQDDQEWFLQEMSRLATMLKVSDAEQLSRVLFDILYTKETMKANFVWLAAFLKSADT